MFALGPPNYGLFVTDKGKPVEKQGRKVSGLTGRTYDSGTAGFDSGCSCFDDSRGAIMSNEILNQARHTQSHIQEDSNAVMAVRSCIVTSTVRHY